MLRPLDKSDIPQLVVLENLTQKAPWSEETFVQCFNSGYFGWLLEQEGVMIGCIILSYQIGECHILNLAVHPDFQHRGLGRKLLTYALKNMKEKGAGITYLEVRRSNVHAIELYKKMGFVEVAVRKKYYQGKKAAEDAIIYAIDLGLD